MPDQRQQTEYEPRQGERYRYDQDDRFDYDREQQRAGRYDDSGEGGRSWERSGEGRWMGAYGGREFAQGGNYGQDYAMQGGGYGGRRAGGMGYGPRYGRDYGQESRYGDQWRGSEQGFRGRDRWGQQWRWPDEENRSQYAGMGGEGHYQDQGGEYGGWNESRYGGSPNWWGGEPYGSERWGPDYERRYGSDNNRWYGTSYGGQRSRSMGQQPAGYGDRARFGYGSEYYGTSPERWDMPPGRHSGKGPRDYRRSDEAIRDDACRLLTQHGDVDASDLNVSVLDGVVTLSGTVDDRGQKRAAEDALDGVWGVCDINNQIRVASAGVPSGSPSSSQSRSSAGGMKQESSSPANGKLTTSGRTR